MKQTGIMCRNDRMNTVARSMVAQDQDYGLDHDGKILDFRCNVHVKYFCNICCS